MAGDLPPDIAAAAGRVVQVAEATPGTVAVALVGSWARSAARPDSDVDIVVLSEQPERWLVRAEWFTSVAAGAVLTSRRDVGALQERRLQSDSGLVIEVNIGRPTWARLSPLDEGTRRVVGDGLLPLWDPQGLLHALLVAVRDEG